MISKTNRTFSKLTISSYLEIPKQKYPDTDCEVALESPNSLMSNVFLKYFQLYLYIPHLVP